VLFRSGIGELPYLVSICFTVLLFVFIIISFNFIDGIDGLASGFGILISIFYAIWFLLTGQKAEALLCFELAGALIAFYRFNVFGRQAKIFMGDAGAMMTGLLISVFTVEFIEFEKNSSCLHHFNAAPALAISLLLVPLLDTIRVLIIRIRDGHLFRGGRNHIHHLMLRVCNSHLKASLLIILYSSVIVILAIVFQPLGNVTLILLMVGLTVIMYLFLIFLVKKFGNEVQNHSDHPSSH
jgi:UDP-N-acetylmuramyl pentapeptide phosphotransferase/UDP-N-acetylglucosamine-1-phosphate transferase